MINEIILWIGWNSGRSEILWECFWGRWEAPASGGNLRGMDGRRDQRWADNADHKNENEIDHTDTEKGDAENEKNGHTENDDSENDDD